MTSNPPLTTGDMRAVFFAVDRALNVDHRDDDMPCACDECMAYGAEDEGADWYRIPPANRIVMRILDGGDDRFALLRTAFRDHEAAALSTTPAPDRLREALDELDQAMVAAEGIPLGLFAVVERVRRAALSTTPAPDLALAAIVEQYLRLDDALPHLKPHTMPASVWEARVREVRNARAGVDAFLSKYREVQP